MSLLMETEDRVLEAALQRPVGERERFAERVLRNQPRSKRRTIGRLRIAEAAGFLEQPIFSIYEPEPEPEIGSRIGPYQLLRKLGEGGMGQVYLAERRCDFREQVALKLIRRHLHSEEVIRRFEKERQILADLEHPNITRLLDGGRTDEGLPYLVMEFVDGEPITEYCRNRHLPIRDRIKLFRKVCEAVHLSHQHLIVHRDLKPSNILVTRDGVPKLLDFGIAKLLNSDLNSDGDETAIGAQRLSFNYASPEQMHGERVHTSSDVYSLGVVLYELLTGSRPHRLQGLEHAEMCRVLQEDPLFPSRAVRLSALSASDPDHPHGRGTDAVSTVDGEGGRARHKWSRALQGDLDAVLLEALRPEPRHRFASVEQLSEDLGRHLDHLPVRSRRSTFAYRWGKFVRRHRTPLVLAVLLLSLSLGFAQQRQEAHRQWVRAEKEELRAERQELLTRRETERLEIVLRTLESTLELMSRPSWLEEPGTVVEANELAVALHQNGHYQASVELLRAALAGDEPLPAELRVSLGNNLALALTLLGELDEAETLLLEGLETRLAVHGEGHPEVAKSLHILGALDYTRGTLSAARQRFERALEIRLQHFSRKDLLVAGVLNNLGLVLAAQGEADTAESFYREALAVRSEKAGSDSLTTARTRKNLAALLADHPPAELGVECEPLARRALATFEGSTKVHNWQIGEVRSILGACLARNGKIEEALPLLEDGYRILRETRGVAVTYTQLALQRLRHGARLVAENL